MFMQKSSHVFSAAFFIVIKTDNNRNVHQLVNKQTVVYLYIGILVSHTKEKY